MKISRNLGVLALFAFCGTIGCQDEVTPEEGVEIRTIENTPVVLAGLEPPPTVEEQSALPKAQPAEGETKPSPKTPQSDAELLAKMALPFAPAIAMDPVDGSKISISTTTPVIEYRNKLYYFSSTKN